MITYINYTKNIAFEEEPNYEYLRGLFKNILDSNSKTFDFIFDWTKPEDIKRIPKQIVYIHIKYNYAYCSFRRFILKNK